MLEIIVKLQPSIGRRLFIVVILALSAVFLFVFAVSESAHSAFLKVILLGFSVAFLWQAHAYYKLSDVAVILTRDGLFDGTGNQICTISNIAKVDRGWFSFKPSNGFLIHLHKPEIRKWSPGLYWCIGSRIGVGGAVSPAQTKELSDKLLLMLQEKTLKTDLL